MIQTAIERHENQGGPMSAAVGRERLSMSRSVEGGSTMVHAPRSGPMPEERQRALAELDAVIERAECTRTRYLVHVEELATAGKDATAAEAMLRQAEDCLVRLHESRAVLVSDWLARPGDEESA